MFRILILAAVVLLAGCADAGTVEEAQETGPKAEVTETTGAICGVVVDGAIIPIADAAVTTMVGGEAQEASTDAEGQFCIGKLDPGFYQVTVTKPGYTEQTIQASAEAGVADPALVRFQIERLFSEDPFVEQFLFKGRLACHVQAGLTAPCVTDWTQLAPGCGSGCVPPLRTILGDARDFIYEVRDGWQSHVVEMTWKQSSQATSSHMGLIMRDFEVGGGSHQFGAMEGTSPLWIMFTVNEAHPTQGGGEPTMIPAEGYDQIIHFAGVRTGEDDLVAAAIEQEFQVFSHTFYYGSAPDEWSFLEGDEEPF